MPPRCNHEVPHGSAKRDSLRRIVGVCEHCNIEIAWCGKCRNWKARNQAKRHQSICRGTFCEMSKPSSLTRDPNCDTPPVSEDEQILAQPRRVLSKPKRGPSPVSRKHLARSAAKKKSPYQYQDFETEEVECEEESEHPRQVPKATSSVVSRSTSPPSSSPQASPKNQTTKQLPSQERQLPRRHDEYNRQFQQQFPPNMYPRMGHHGFQTMPPQYYYGFQPQFLVPPAAGSTNMYDGRASVPSETLKSINTMPSPHHRVPYFYEQTASMPTPPYGYMFKPKSESSDPRSASRSNPFMWAPPGLPGMPEAQLLQSKRFRDAPRDSAPPKKRKYNPKHTSSKVVSPPEGPQKVPPVTKLDSLAHIATNGASTTKQNHGALASLEKAAMMLATLQ